MRSWSLWRVLVVAAGYAALYLAVSVALFVAWAMRHRPPGAQWKFFWLVPPPVLVGSLSALVLPPTLLFAAWLAVRRRAA